MRDGKQKYGSHKVDAVTCAPVGTQQHDKPQHQHKKQSDEAENENPSANPITFLLSDCGASKSLCNLHKNPAAISVLLFGQK